MEGSAVAQRSASQAAINFCRSSKGKSGSVFAHEEYCDYYYECDPATDEPVLQACPNGLAFAGKGRGLTGSCDYPHRVSCPDGTRTIGRKYPRRGTLFAVGEPAASPFHGRHQWKLQEANLSSDNFVNNDHHPAHWPTEQPITTDNCQWQYGVFPHATSCTRYWHCWNGTATIQQCPFSLLYNDAIHSCDWPDNVPDCQKHPICKDTPNGLVFIEKSCVRYWLCVGGYPRLQRCAAGLAVNPNTLKCELASTVPGCEPPPTQPPAEEESSSPAPGAGQPAAQADQGQPGEQNGGSPSQASLSRPLQTFNPSGPFRPSAQNGNPRLVG